MRKFLVPALLAIGVTALVNTADVSFHGSSLTTAAVAQQNGGAPAADRAPDFKANVDINTGTPSTTVHETRWVVDPLWIGLGGRCGVAGCGADLSRTRRRYDHRQGLTTDGIVSVARAAALKLPRALTLALALVAFLLELGDHSCPQ
jgi:hypothetical protein